MFLKMSCHNMLVCRLGWGELVLDLCTFLQKAVLLLLSHSNNCFMNPSAVEFILWSITLYLRSLFISISEYENEIQLYFKGSFRFQYRINIPHTVTAIKIKHTHKSLQDWGQNIFKCPLTKHILYKKIFLAVIYARASTR